MDELAGKVAVVTGGASGIGLALGHAFAAEQMKVVLADVDTAGLEEAKRAVGEKGVDVHTIVCDVSDPDAVDRLRDEVVRVFGTAHVVCNNAGVGGGGPSWEIPISSWQWVLGVNLFGVIHGIRSFVPLLLEQEEGHVVNTASAAGLLTMPYMGPYSASKHAVVAITEGLHMELELAGAKVGASVLCPMWVRTRIHESDRNAPEHVRDAWNSAAEEVPGQEANLRDVISALVLGGMAPETVAENVVDAVKTGSFWVLPHEDVRGAVTARAERIASGSPPQMVIPT